MRGEETAKRGDGEPGRRFIVLVLLLVLVIAGPP